MTTDVQTIRRKTRYLRKGDVIVQDHMVPGKHGGPPQVVRRTWTLTEKPYLTKIQRGKEANAFTVKGVTPSGTVIVSVVGADQLWDVQA